MDNTLLAAIVGGISGILGSTISVYYAYKNLKSEYRGKLDLEIISKQINSCEKLWSVLVVASKTPGKDRVISYKGEQFLLSTKIARNLFDEINQILNSATGLYFSRDLRKNIFALRDFIQVEFLQHKQQSVIISKTKAARFDGHVQNLRVSIRTEIGVVDLLSSQKGPLE